MIFFTWETRNASTVPTRPKFEKPRSVVVSRRFRSQKYDSKGTFPTHLDLSDHLDALQKFIELGANLDIFEIGDTRLQLGFGKILWNMVQRMIEKLISYGLVRGA